jgi:carbonic anhydrase/acetyltransferase-like protein (isoleucine patch superfamily)
LHPVANADEIEIMPLYALGDKSPSIDPTAFVHPDAVIIGDVTIGAESSVWPTSVLRGDHGAIRVGAATSIQDGTIVHCTKTLDTVVGDRCVVGHNVHLEGCTIEDDCLIGSGSVVLHRVTVRTGALVAAQAMVANGTEVPSRAMALGIPAKIKLDAVSAGAFNDAVAVYVGNAHWYNAELRRID